MTTDYIQLNSDFRPVFKKNIVTCIFIMSLYLVFLTISWDRVSVRFMSSTFRLMQLFLVLCLLMWIAIKVSNESFRFRKSGLIENWIFLFALWCIGTCITSYNIKRSIMYSIWMVFNVLTIALIVDYVGTSRTRMRQLFRIYFISFILISFIAVITSILECVGVLNLAVNPETGKRISRGVFRMFGLSYEPSYFATYLLTCLVVISYLQLRGSEMLEELKFKKWQFYVILGAFIGSFSRAGFAVFLPIVSFMVLYELLYARKYRRWMVSKWIFKAGLILVIFMSLAGFTLVSKSKSAKDLDQYFFAGMGFGAHSKSAHSSGTRLIETAMTLQAGVFNPWMGVGMGGFGAYFVDNIKNFPLREFWLATALGNAFRQANKWHFIEIRDPEAMCVSAEVFATVGVPGLILWLIINIVMPFRLFRLSKNMALDRGMRTLLRAMAWGHIALFTILHFNQNYMRPYYWLNIAMCCSLYLVAKSSIENPENNKSRLPAGT